MTTTNTTDIGSGAPVRGARIAASLAAAAALLCAIAAQVQAQGTGDGALFPKPFVVEHQVIHTDANGGVFAGDPVTDYYGGSWIVSQRPGGSRVILDFAQREMTEVRHDRNTFAVLSFDRFAELRRRLRRAEGPAVKAESTDGDAEERSEPAFVVEERAPLEDRSAKAGGPDEALMRRTGVRRLQVALADENGAATGPKVEVWLDPEIRLGPAAMTAIEDFEKTLSSGDGPKTTPPYTRYLMEARRRANGALPIKTVRPAAQAESGVGIVEDRASRVERLPAFPSELLEIPEGFTRVPHKLELIVSHAEEEADLRAAMRPDAKK